MARPKVNVVMIHGAFCGPWAFEHWRKPFEARGYKLHLPTLRFHDCGRNPPAALGTTSLLDYAADLEHLLDDIDAPAILVGHSMGGLLAQMLAAKRKVAACILLAPSAPYGVFPATPFEIASAQALYLAGDFWNKPLKPERWIAANNALDMLPEKEHDAVFAQFVPESGLATFEIMQWALDGKRASAIDAAAVKCPMLCLVGSRDRVNSPGTVRSVARRYRDHATFEELKRHSHWLIGEPGWEKIADRALGWLDSVLTVKPAR